MPSNVTECLPWLRCTFDLPASKGLSTHCPCMRVLCNVGLVPFILQPVLQPLPVVVMRSGGLYSCQHSLVLLCYVPLYSLPVTSIQTQWSVAVVPVVYSPSYSPLHYVSHLGEERVVISLNDRRPVLLHHVKLQPLLHVWVLFGCTGVYVRLCICNSGAMLLPVQFVPSLLQQATCSGSRSLGGTNNRDIPSNLQYSASAVYRGSTIPWTGPGFWTGWIIVQFWFSEARLTSRCPN